MHYKNPHKKQMKNSDKKHWTINNLYPYLGHTTFDLLFLLWTSVQQKNKTVYGTIQRTFLPRKASLVSIGPVVWVRRLKRKSLWTTTVTTDDEDADNDC